MSQQTVSADSLAGCTSSQDCGKAKGTCPVCHESGLRLTLAGRMYSHGAKTARCLGVGQLPLQSAVYLLNTSAVNATSLTNETTLLKQKCSSQSCLITETSSSVSPALSPPT